METSAGILLQWCRRRSRGRKRRSSRLHRRSHCAVNGKHPVYQHRNLIHFYYTAPFFFLSLSRVQLHSGRAAASGIHRLIQCVQQQQQQLSAGPWPMRWCVALCFLPLAAAMAKPEAERKDYEIHTRALRSAAALSKEPLTRATLLVANTCSPRSVKVWKKMISV